MNFFDVAHNFVGDFFTIFNRISSDFQRIWQLSGYTLKKKVFIRTLTGIHKQNKIKENLEEKKAVECREIGKDLDIVGQTQF